MKQILIFFISICLFTQVYGQSNSAPTDLPQISVIGNFLGSHSDSYKSFDVKELEFSYQHYLYPSVKVDIFTALHKEGTTRSFELEEAYVTFSDVFGVFFPSSPYNIGVGAILGQKLVNIGKINPLHPEQRNFVDRPLATQQFFGGEEGLSGEGAILSYLLPLPFFSQLETGYFTYNGGHEEHGEEEGSHGVEYEGKLLNFRSWNSFKLSDSQEIELGLNYLVGNATARSEDDQSHIIGSDITFSKNIDKNKSLKLQLEFYEATYGEEGESRETQTGGFVTGMYKFNKYYQTGIRYGTLSKHGDEGSVINQLSLVGIKQLTETSKFKVQYNTGENIEDTFYAQFIFGFGPHSHVLQ
ncbi:hypothetical protein DID78_00890 [Candidatus Marinamargulisbacteria bacterium SCGC AG-343-D04]|nr:hypothetical protein DID78_00890 [Candidatus Marinamargulisbacteria bacterium SCGC AG-343-D04]